MASLVKFKRQIKILLTNVFGIVFFDASETSRVRHLVLPFCVGYGCDIGFGGEKIVQNNCDGIDLPLPYAFVGKDKIDIPCDVIKEEIPINDNTYDYVYSSHLIEDFVDTSDALKKFIRVLKNNGNLILVFPDQQKYEEICNRTGQPKNEHHVHATMGYDYMIHQLQSLTNIQFEVLFSSNCEINYNVVIVAKISKL
jgi:SAM-dependent methyltransferase